MVKTVKCKEIQSSVRVSELAQRDTSKRTKDQVYERYSSLIPTPLPSKGGYRMQTKSIGMILDAVCMISIVVFFGTLAFNQLRGVGSEYRGFALSWLFIWIFTATLGFRGGLDAHKDALRGYVIEWIIACLVGAVLTLFVLVVT
jgi:hypothetical protein